MRRRTFLGLAAAAAVASAVGPAPVLALESAKKRLGLIFGRHLNDPLAKVYRDAFWEGAAKHGWSEERLLTEYRWGADTAPIAMQAAQEIMAARPDVLFAGTSQPI